MWFYVVFSVIFIVIANGEESQNQNADITTYLYLDRDNPVDIEVGQGDQVYCKLVDPNENTVLDGFSRCRLTLDRVGSEHEGLWKMYIGYSGRVTVEREILSVTVTEPESKTNIVKTDVIDTHPGVKITCLLPDGYKVRGCQFHGPINEVLFVSGSYQETIHGRRYTTQLEDTECSVSIVEPDGAYYGQWRADHGRWRCAMEAENGTYYAFLDNYVGLKDDHYVTKPKIEPSYAKTISGLENEPVTLSCSINAEIKYCDFRDSNGTIYPVFPGMKSSSVEYVGSGFSAGECGIKMILPASENEHVWYCNIGLMENTKEYKTLFKIHVKEYLQVTQQEISSGSIAVSASTYNGETPEYCRFLRSDGLTFTTENTPVNYNGYISGRICEITTHNPTPFDRQPWIVFAKLRHVNWEINKQTSGLVLPDELDVDVEPPSFTHSSRPVFLYLMLSVIMLSFIATIAFAPKKNRQWVSSRTTAVRQSLRLRKTPLAEHESTLPSATGLGYPPPYAQLA